MKPRQPKAKPVKIADGPWQPCQTWEAADAVAIQALFQGVASDYQQKRAINFITNDLCALPFLAFDPANQRNTDFALGKQSVGHAIVRLMRLNVKELTKETEQ